MTLRNARKQPSGPRRGLWRGRRLELEALEGRIVPSGDWALAISSRDGVDAWGTAVDASGNVYVSGAAYGCLDGRCYVDFDPGTDFSSMDSTGKGRSYYLAKYSADGDFLWVRPFGSEAWASRVALGPDGAVYVTGSFAETAGFGPDSLTSAGRRDVF